MKLLLSRKMKPQVKQIGKQRKKYISLASLFLSLNIHNKRKENELGKCIN